MAKFQVTLRQDAWINYVATLEADTADQAAQIAVRAWKDQDLSIQFEAAGVTEFDDVLCDPEECQIVP